MNMNHESFSFPVTRHDALIWRYRFRLQKVSKMVFNSWKNFHTSKFVLSFLSVDLFIKLVNWSGKRTRKWNVAYNIPLFTHKMVRKFGQKRDFAKFHSKPKHQVLNIYKNGLGRVERTLWTSSGSNMRVWRPKTKNPPALLAIPWFWAFFSVTF